MKMHGVKKLAGLLVALAMLSVSANAEAAGGCHLQRKINSIKSNEAVTVRFINRSGGYRVVTWLDFNGNPVDYKHLQAGEAYTQKSFVGHAWMITDGPGNCRRLVILRRGTRRVNINR